MSQLSGGQAARAALAALLLSRFDIVLLDEPTNDLDFDGLERLEDFLDRRGGGLVVVSHDRAFLERIVTSVGEIDPGSHRLTLYRGGWQAYLDARATAQRHAEEAHVAYSTERDRLLARARQQRQWAVTGVSKAAKSPKDNDKMQRDFRLNRTEKPASKVRSTERALERLAEVEKPFEPWTLHLEMAAAPRSGDVVVRLEGAVVRRGDWHLGPIDLEVGWSDRLGILGRNGAGKTTLLSMILGTTPLDEGKRWIGPRVVFGELGQARRRFDTSEPLMTGFVAASGLRTREARSLLAKFALGAGEVERAFGTLSPGERTRAELALLMSKGTNCLVLDEPTNHLDLPAIAQLEVARRHAHRCPRASRRRRSRPWSRTRSDARIYAPKVTDAEAMAAALREAVLALDHDDVPVGAVVLIGGHVIAQRHNERELRKDPTAHAEILALQDAAEMLGTWHLDGATLVVTLEPCPMCAGAAVLARVNRLVFGAFDPKTGACGSLFNLCADPRLNHEIEVLRGVSAAPAAALLRDFFASRRDIVG
jgi:tRNA(Arg) A34 adenosine deaminase TadA/ABC-type multidrug transport system ATPase subunit